MQYARKTSDRHCIVHVLFLISISVQRSKCIEKFLLSHSMSHIRYKMDSVLDRMHFKFNDEQPFIVQVQLI